MKPTYATFEQATKLSDLKANLSSNRNQWLLSKDKEDISKAFICNDNELESYTQIGEDTEHNVYHCLSIPEQWQVVEWLRINHGIWVSVDMIYEIDQTGFWFSIRQSKDDDMGIFFDEYPTPQEAYSAAFDYILNKLI